MVAVAGFLLIPTSCSQDSESVSSTSTSESDMLISIGVSLPAENATSEDGDGYEVGTGYENYIDVAGDNYRFYFFDCEDNTFIARFTPDNVIKTEDSDGVVYNVTGKGPDELFDCSNFKLMVLANWENSYDESGFVEGTTTIDDICEATWSQYTHKSDFVLSTSNLIPFYGIHEYEGVTFTKGEYTDLGESVTLLRAMAKVEVSVDSEDDELELSSVKICRYNNKGYCAPYQVYSEDDYDHDYTWSEDFVSTLHLVGKANDTENETVTDARKLDFLEQGDGTWIAYVPEYSNEDDDFAYIEIRFTYQTKDEDPYIVYFAEYEDGTTDNTDIEKRVNIERNNLYRFTVDKTPLLFKVSVTAFVYGGTESIDL